MDWKNAPIARAASIPGAMDLSLEDISLLGGLYKLTRAQPSKVMCWAYFEKAFALSVSKARTRLTRLEKAGLVVRRMVGTVSASSGSQIVVTSKGKDLLRIVSPLLAQPEVDRAGEGARAASSAPATPAGVGVSFSPGSMSYYPETFQKAVLKMGIDVVRAVRSAIERGLPLSVPDGCALGLKEAETHALNAAIARFAPKPAEAVRLNGAGMPGRPEGEWEGTLVEAAGDEAAAAARREGVPLPEVRPDADAGITGLAKLIAAEAATRYRSALCGRSTNMVAARFNEIVWSCTKGPLADFGLPIKRVRVALSLLAKGRWETPLGFDPSGSPQVFVGGLLSDRSQ